MVHLVVGGDEDTLAFVYETVRNNKQSVIVFNGSGGAAELIAFVLGTEYKHLCNVT